MIAAFPPPPPPNHTPNFVTEEDGGAYNYRNNVLYTITCLKPPPSTLRPPLPITGHKNTYQLRCLASRLTTTVPTRILLPPSGRRRFTVDWGGGRGWGAIILAITHRQDWYNKQAYRLMIERPRDQRGEGREAGNDYSPTVDLYMEHEQGTRRARDQFLTVFGACPESGAAQRQRQSGGR